MNYEYKWECFSCYYILNLFLNKNKIEKENIIKIEKGKKGVNLIYIK